MKAYEYILTRQIQWALNRGIPLIGSKGQRGRAAYTKKLKYNLFEPLEADVRKRFTEGDGAEISKDQDNPDKMNAVHSSSALAVNIFQYWHKIDEVPLIAAACGFCRKGNKTAKRIVFEDKYPIIDKKRHYPPNIDIVIYNSDFAKVKRLAIECKFTEAYSSYGSHGLKQKYLDIKHIWHGIPKIHSLAKSICPNDQQFVHLHPAQLIKHILGLKKDFGKDGFRLLYLWYDVLGKEGASHREEIGVFSDIVKSDSVKFHAMSYQELIAKLSNKYRSDHAGYIKYISDRYL